MVANVNSACFQIYGTLPDDEAYRKNCREYLIRPDGENGGFICDTHRVLLVPSEGMSALRVCFQESQDIFYLDKPVLLKRRVSFQLFSMNASGCVKVYIPWDAELKIREGKGSLPELTLEAAVRIERIYTIFSQEKAGGFFFHGEKHEPYELTAVQTGRLHCVVGGQEYTLREGEVFLFLPQQWHMQYAGPEEAVSFFTVSFDLYCHQASQMAGQVFSANEKMRECLKKLADENVYPKTTDADRLILYLTELMMEMRQMAVEKGGQMGSYNPLTEKAMRFINDHLHEHMTVSRVAAAINVSAPYLAVLFRRYLHQSPADTIRRLKMEEGRKLIGERGMNVQETAGALGFATPQHFSRCFKEYFGYAPKACMRKKE